MSPRFPPAASRNFGRGALPRSVLLGLPLLLAPLALSVPGVLPGVAGELGTAGIDLVFSFLRMSAAYALSLAFAVAYGYYAASRKTGERILIPVLDVLQSVPILGFFPFAITFFVKLTGPGSFLGPNLASIFLIFTSMSWNLAFGVYESLKGIPKELQEAADAFGIRGPQRFRTLLIPSTVNRLVYNSVLSWAGGWFFLVAAEVFSAGAGTTEQLPGIGSFLAKAALSGNGDALLAGFILLVLLITFLDLAVWRPLGRWAERFRYDQTPSREAEITGLRRGSSTFRRAVGLVARGVRSGVSAVASPFLGLAEAASRPAPVVTQRRLGRGLVGWVVLGGILVLVWLLLIVLVEDSYHILTGPILPGVVDQIRFLPLALGASFLRVVLGYLASVSIALPLALLIYRRPRAGKVVLPAVEIVASVPATALFPLLVFALVPSVGLEGTSILMLVTGMIWYLFFNILSGLRAIPPDLEEAAASFGLRRDQYYRRLVLPAMFPALVTGSITAFGGGWNALIVAEYFSSGTRTFQVPGIGDLLNIGNNEAGGLPLLLVALFTLILTVVSVNEVLWKPLYRRALERFRYD
jgi:NitT/TauT family transport system permease protein